MRPRWPSDRTGISTSRAASKAPSTAWRRWPSRTGRHRSRRRLRDCVRFRRLDVCRRSIGHDLPRRATGGPPPSRRCHRALPRFTWRWVRMTSCSCRRRRSAPTTTSIASAAMATCSTLPSPLGRPQGLAFSPDGVLHVVDALAGASGLYRFPDLDGGAGTGGLRWRDGRRGLRTGGRTGRRVERDRLSVRTLLMRSCSRGSRLPISSRARDRTRCVACSAPAI